MQTYLLADERVYLGTLSSLKRRYEFSAGRGLTRQLLTSQLGCSPNAIKISLPDGRPPRLHVKDCEFYLSLSHSSQGIACLVSPLNNVGIDLEYTRKNRRFAELAQAHPALSDITPDAGTFYQRWVTLEAQAKYRRIPLLTLLHQPFQLQSTEKLTLHQQDNFVYAIITHADEALSQCLLPSPII